MTTKRLMVCDRCGKEEEANPSPRGWGRMWAKGHYGTDLHGSMKEESADLCKKCYESLQVWWGQPVTQAVKEAADDS